MDTIRNYFNISDIRRLSWGGWLINRFLGLSLLIAPCSMNGNPGADIPYISTDKVADAFATGLIEKFIGKPLSKTSNKKSVETGTGKVEKIEPH